MTTQPKVSILCLTYNQSKYIRETLDSFLAQKTDFPIEILINDDASTDGTREILKDYEKKHPGLIRTFLQKENQYSKGLRGFIPRFLLPHAQGKYLAICEGDDYWTDPNKLQKQVDFLESHSSYTVCFHAVKVIFENQQKPFVFPDVKDQDWYTTDVLLQTNYIPTNSVVYRKLNYTDYPVNISPADWYMHLYHAKSGKIKFIDEVMSVYRKHEGGIWWDYDKDRDELWKKHGMNHLAMEAELLKLFKDNAKYTKTIHTYINRLMDHFLTIDLKHGDDLFLRAMNLYPDIAHRYAMDRHKGYEVDQKQAEKYRKQILKLGDERNELTMSVHQLQKELEMIKNSRTWKLRGEAVKLRDINKKQENT